MKDLRALAQQIKVVPGSVEDTRTGKGESVRESPLVGNTVRAGKIPCQKKKYSMGHLLQVRATIYATHAKHLKKRCVRCWACEKMVIHATCEIGEKCKRKQHK